MMMNSRTCPQAGILPINPERVTNGHKLAVLMEKRKEQPAKKPIGDGLIITTVVAKAVKIFLGPMPMGVGQHDTLVISTLLVWLFSFPVWER